MRFYNCIFLIILLTLWGTSSGIPAGKTSFLAIESQNIGFSEKQVEEAFQNLDKVRSHSLGKKILDTVAIQLKSEVPLKEIAKLLNDLKDELERQQSEVDKTRSEYEESCTFDINRYDERIDDSNEAINDIDLIIIKLKNSLVTLNSTIKNREFQLELLGRKFQEVTTLRERDEADFERRRRQSGEILTAISLIIPKLESLESKKEIQEVLMQLSATGKSNPINSLVFLSSTFENYTLDVIKEKLHKLKTSIEASLDDDETYDAEAARGVKILLEEIKQSIKEVEAEKFTEEGNKREADRNLQLQLSRREELSAEITASRNGKGQRVRQCSDYFNNYRMETAQRNEEIRVVANVQSLLASKMDIVKKYINENE